MSNNKSHLGKNLVITKIKKHFKIFILIFTLMAAGAGAAAGTVLAGTVDGEVNVSVSQPLQVESPSIPGLPAGRAWFGAASDDGTQFSAAAQLYQGESATIEVPIVNQAAVNHVVEITVIAPILTVPTGGNPADYSINLDVDGSGSITDVVRVGPYTWKCTTPAESQGRESTPFDGIELTVALGDMVPPGYYELTGQMQVVPY
jgi:hypothetical protein